MRILFLLCTALIGGFSIQAQTTFGQAYYNADGSAKLVALPEGKTLVTMGRGPALTKLDSVGELIWTKWKWANGSQFIYWPLAVAPYTEDLLYFIGGYEDGMCNPPQGMAYNQIQPVVGKMDSALVVQDARRYEMNGACTSFPKDILLRTSGGVITWGAIRNGFYILDVDSTLDPNWAHVFDRKGGFKFVKELPGGDLLVGLNLDTAGAVVARIDAGGDFLWCKSYIRPRGVVHDAVVESDDSFVITGYTDSTGSVTPLPLGYDPKLFMMKLNGSGEVQWCKGYEGSGLWYSRHGQQTVGTSDTGYVLLAQAAGKPVLLKINNNGDTLWTRTTNTPEYSYQAIDLIKREDGGNLMSMGVIGGELNGPALMKADSLGHFPCGDQSYPVQVMDLFPVDSAFTLTPSASGATAYPVTFRDTILEPITTHDFCDIVTAVPDPMRRRQLHIHPNPSTGHFILEFPDPLTVDSFYSVYDATGRLLFQRPLSKSMETVEIDLSEYGKGMYLIRFSDRDGVCAERVVVE